MSLTSVIRYAKALDSSATDGSGKTGLAFSDVTAKYLAQGGTLTGLTTETVTTLGTYQAPTSAAHVRIKELSSSDPTKGVYEIHLHNTQVANSGKKLWLFLSAAGAAFQPLEVDLTDADGRLPASLGANGNLKADVRDLLGTAWLTPAVAGTPDVNAKQLGGTAQTGRDVGASVLLAASGLDAVVVETGLNARQALSLIAAEAAGAVSGGGTSTITIKGAGVSTTRIVSASADVDGNRPSLTLTPPA